jgi:maltose O-acetyltransferase
MDAYNTTSVRQGPLRRRLMEALLGSVGESAEIRPPLYVDCGSHISIGARCFANFGLVALDVAPITIGDDVQIGPNVQLLTPTHPVAPQPRRDKWEAAKPIRVDDNAWLGGGAIVLAGVTIGANTVVGAGAVVTRDLPANVVAVGNPARAVRTIDEETLDPSRERPRTAFAGPKCSQDDRTPEHVRELSRRRQRPHAAVSETGLEPARGLSPH